MELFVRIAYAVLIIAAIVAAYVLGQKAKKSDAPKDNIKTWHRIMVLVSAILPVLFTVVPPETIAVRVDPLLRAQKLYDKKDYEGALVIYAKPELENDPIALSNQAYILQYEVAGEADLAKVWEMYKQAAETGDKEAISNLLTFTLRYPYSYEEVIRVLDLGAQPALLRYFADYYNEDEVEPLGIDFLTSKDSGLIKSVLDLQMKPNHQSIYSFMFEDAQKSEFFRYDYEFVLYSYVYRTVGYKQTTNGNWNEIREEKRVEVRRIPTQNVWLGFDVQTYVEKKLLRPEGFIRV